LLADAEHTKKTLADLVSTRDQAIAAAKALGETNSKIAELDRPAADLTKSEAALAEAREDLQRQRDELTFDRAAHAAEVEQLRHATDKLTADRAAHERAVRQHQDKLAALRTTLG
jgi:chromosome segregation ATPase